MKYPSSNKTSSFGIRPHIKKGYYPGKLLSVKEYTDGNGKVKIGKYGKQLIFEFAVYEKDQETDAPISPMKYCTDEKLKTEAPVIISNFVYHMYKKTEKGQAWVEGEFQTAITPNSNITKVLKALGWVFTADGIDPEDFVDNWVELNIDDYSQGEGDEAYTASTIKDVGPYKGPEVKDVEDVKPTEKPKKVEKQVKHKDVEDSIAQEGKVAASAVLDAQVSSLQSKIDEITKLNKDGFLTDDGLKQAKEQIETQIEDLKK